MTKRINSSFRERHWCPLDRPSADLLRLRAFSLVEILMVVSIVAVLAGVVVFSLGSADGRKLESAQGVLAAQLTLARNAAIGLGAETRVLISAESGGTSAGTRYLRAILPVYRDEGADPADPSDDMWRPLDKVTLLPSNIYYVPNGGAVAPSGGAASVKESSMAPTMQFAYPAGATSATRWFYYAFDRRGMARSIVNPQSFSGAVIVLAAGRNTGTDTAPAIRVFNEQLCIGLALRGSGFTLGLNDYTYVESALNN